MKNKFELQRKIKQLDKENRLSPEEVAGLESMKTSTSTEALNSIRSKFKDDKVILGNEPTPSDIAIYESMKEAPVKVKTKVVNARKAKTIKHSTKLRTQAKKTPPDIMFTLDVFTMRQKPINQLTIEQIAYRLIQWVSTKKEIILDDFLQQEGYRYKEFKRLRDKCPKLEEAYQYAKMSIGNKREREALYNRMNPAMVMKSMPSYSPRWEKLIEWYSSTQVKTPQQPTEVTVNIVKAQETGIPYAKDDKIKDA